MTPYQSAIEAIELLEYAGFQARLAGGCVRDRLLGHPPKDYDIATTSFPDETRQVFQHAGLRTIPTGIKHGTITFLAESGGIEITTLRADVKTDGRHAEVAFSKDFTLDASRRDFTVNAMFEDRHGKIYDYFNGQSDLHTRSLVFVGEAENRIKEDYLRIMRLFRFWAQLGFTPTDSALTAVGQCSSNLVRISQERITAELLAILAEASIVPVVEKMFSLGVIKTIMPEISFKTEVLPLLKQTSLVQHRWLARLALLLENLASEELSALLARLRLSNQQCAQVETLILTVPTIVSLTKRKSKAMAVIDTIEKRTYVGSFLSLFFPIWSVRNFGEAFAEHLSYMFNVENQYKEVRRKPLPITGNDLLQHLQIKPSEKVGLLLAELERQFRDDKWQTRAEGLTLAKQQLEKLQK